MAKIAVELDEDVFRELQRLAEPLVDDISDVIRKALAESRSASGPSEAQEVTLTRGESLPVGLKLRATFRGQQFVAEVTPDGITFDGQMFDSLSAAARAVKARAGLSEKSSQTNGWHFWKYLDRTRMRYLPAQKLRDGTGAPSVRAPLTIIGIGNSGYTDTSELASDPVPPLSWR